MNILVKYGGVTNTLDFLPPPTTDGLYLTQLIPTRVGSYYLILNRTIQGQKIGSQVPLDLVDSSQKFAFPDTGGGSVIHLLLKNLNFYDLGKMHYTEPEDLE